jgi:hypothetical protein
MKHKIDHSMALIASALVRSARPAVLTSFGKDSMVLLHLIRQVAPAMPDCIFFREPFHQRKYRFAQQIAETWGLSLYDWRPSNTKMQQRDDDIEVLNSYFFSRNKCLTCPTGIVPPVPGEPWLCALADLYQKPLAGPMAGPWDMAFIGHKACDTDPVLGGDVGTRIDVRVNPESRMELAFPLRDWTHADIWSYSLANQVPQNMDRYQIDADGMGHENLEDVKANPDYFRACTACMDSRASAPAFVPCPRRAGAMIENVSASLRWAPTQVQSYMQDRKE